MRKVTSSSSSLLHSSEQVEDSRVVHVLLEGQSLRETKRIPVTFQETVTSLIRRALDQNLLQHEDVDNFELLYMMSEDEKIKVSDHSLVCLSMNLGVQYFIVRKRPQVKGKEFLEPSVAVASRTPAAVSSSSAVAAGSLPQATQSNECCMRKVTSSSSSLLHSSEQVEDSRVVHVLLEGQSLRETKRIPVTFQETVTSLIRRALDQNLLQHEDVDNFELLYMMSEDEKIKVSDHSLVCLSMNLGVQYFIVRKRPQVKGKEFLEPSVAVASRTPAAVSSSSAVAAGSLPQATQSNECCMRKVTSSSSSLLHSSEQVEDSRVVHVLLEGQSLRETKRIPVTFQETVTSLIRRALDQNLLQHEDVDNFELLYMMSEDEKIKVSDHSLVCLSMNLGVQYFIVRKRPQVKGKEFLEPSVAVASRTPAAVSSSSAVAAGSLPQATQSNECCMRKVTSSSSSLLHSSEQVEDSRVVHVLLEGQSLRETKRIPVTFQETVTSLIRRALDQNLLQHEDVDNFELLYMMSEDEKIKVSDHSLVCLSMNLGVQYFIVRKRPQVKGKEFLEPSVAVASRTPAAVSSSSAVAAGSLPQATQSNECCMRKVTSSSSSLLHSSEQVEDSRVVHVLLEGQSLRETKRIPVTFQETVTSLIRRALDQNLLQHEDVDNFELLYMMSEDEKIKVSDHSLVCLSMNLGVQYFIVRKRPQVKGKEFLEPSVAVASRTPAAVSSSSAVAAGSLPQATQSNECCMRKVTSSSSSLLHSSEQVEDSRVVHVLLEGQSLRETKRIPVTFQETVTSLIRRALDQNLLQHEDVDNFELLYMMSEDEKIKVSDHSLVCLSMNLGVQYFIVRKRPQVKGKEFLEPSVAVASRTPAAVSSSSAVAAGSLPQATQSNECCMRKVTSSSSSLLHSSEQVEDSRVVHVLLEGQSLRETKRIPVTFQETVTSLIRRALDQNLLQHEDVDNFELLYMMSEDEKIKVSDHSLVCLSMNLGVQYFIVRKRPQVKGKEVNTYLIQAVHVLPFHSDLRK
ncbi:uncharacterized protein ACH125_027534 [Urocitellus parryii]